MNDPSYSRDLYARTVVQDRHPGSLRARKEKTKNTEKAEYEIRIVEESLMAELEYQWKLRTKNAAIHREANLPQ